MPDEIELLKQQLKNELGEEKYNLIYKKRFSKLHKGYKALLMICDHDVTPSDIIMCKDYDAYMFKRDYQEGWTLSKEQFDFLKGALNEIL